MVKGLVGVFASLLVGLFVLNSAVLAQSSVNISVTAGYDKGNGRFNIVVKDTPGSKLELYVNDKSPTKATVNKKDWATFKKVKLTGSGKISFTKILKNGKQQAISYTQSFTVTNDKVTFSNYIQIKTITQTKSIPFTSTTVQDSSLAKGTTQISTAGVNGTETLTYQDNYTDSKLTSQKLISTVITAQPVSQVTSVGTYVASATTPTPTPTTPTCYPLTNGGNCYEPGEYCRTTDHGASGVAGDGKSITCEDNDGWRWEPN